MIEELLSALLHLLHVLLKLILLLELLGEEVLELGLVLVIGLLLDVLLFIEKRELRYVHLHLLLLGLQDGLLMLLELVVRQLRVTEVAHAELLRALLGKPPLVIRACVAHRFVASAAVMSRITLELIEGSTAVLACVQLVELSFDVLLELVG